MIIFLEEENEKIVFILLIGGLFLTGCAKEKSENKIDYSNYSFTDVNWVRDSGNDIETIRFKSDGRFNYYCACGNPVNDADMCENYIYNDDKKEIILDCFETTEDTITIIKIVEFNEDNLKLDFDGEIRSFKKEK